MGKKRKADELKRNDSTFYEIEYIYAARRVARKTASATGWEFLVKWFNYPLTDISWEPYKNLDGCNEIINSFWKDTGFPNKSRYPPGYTVYASADFIEHWKRNAQNASKGDETTPSKTGVEEEMVTDDDKPLSELLPMKLKIKIPSSQLKTQAPQSSMVSNPSQLQGNGADSIENAVIQPPDPITRDKTLTPTDNNPTEDMLPGFEEDLTISSADQPTSFEDNLTISSADQPTGFEENLTISSADQPTGLSSNDSPLHLTHEILQNNPLSPMLQSRLSLSYGDQPTEFELEISKLFSDDDGLSPLTTEVSGNSSEQPSLQPHQSQSRSELAVSLGPSINVNDGFEGLLFPCWLHDYMSNGERPYCLWADNSSQQAECETERLKLILKLYKHAADVGHIPDVRIVFIHVGSLPTIRLLPSLASRLNGLTTMFTLFGTDPALPPFQWGFREIFPIGGIVTFTAEALLEDPFGIYLLITQIAEHPLWASYIIPSVFGMAVKLLYRDEDPLEAFDCGSFAYQDFLIAIDDGAISLVRAPSTEGHPEWLHDQVVSQFRSCRETLEFCLQEFTSTYGDVAESEYASRLASEIVEDFTAMRIQPSIMRDYRRFVILKQSHDATPADHHSFEWVHVSRFDSADRFFEWKG